MTINGTEIDFNKQRGYFFNCDCLEAMKQMPDKCIDLCICDPPYGAGFTEGGGCQGWFSKYHQSEEKSSQFCKVERERERKAKPWRTSDKTRFGGNFDRYKEQAELGLTNTPKKSYRGTQPRIRNTLKNFSVSHAIRLYGAVTTLNFHLQGAL